MSRSLKAVLSESVKPTGTGWEPQGFGVWAKETGTHTLYWVASKNTLRSQREKFDKSRPAADWMTDIVNARSHVLDGGGTTSKEDGGVVWSMKR